MSSHFFLEGSEIIPLPFFSPHKHCIHPRDLGRVAPEPINQQVFTEPSRVPGTVPGAGGGGGGLPKEHVAGSLPSANYTLVGSKIGMPCTWRNSRTRQAHHLLLSVFMLLV